MNNFFLSIYNWLGRSRLRLWGCLTLCLIALLTMASRLRLSENLQDFFPSQDEETTYVLGNLKAMDRVSFLFQQDDSTSSDAYALIDAAEACAAQLDSALAGRATIQLFYGPETILPSLDFIYAHLPLFLTDDDYNALESLSPDSLKARLSVTRSLLSSQASMVLSPVLERDPLLLAAPVLQRQNATASFSSLSLTDGYLMSPDGTSLLLFATLNSDFSETGDNASLVKDIYATADNIRAQYPHVSLFVYGAPLVAVSNSDRVKSDEWLTMSIALSILIVVMFLIFRSLRSLFLLIVPVVFGGLFALAIISILGIELSQIALGTSATILGVALSYSIHMVTHGLHVSDVRQLIREMAWPMTVGSITTIGAFLALIFTNSRVLHDLGLFASLSLIGTLLFCLIFLPHLMKVGHRKDGFMLRFVERIAGYDYSRCRPLVLVLCALFVVCLFFFTDVRFNEDMSSLNYRGDEALQTSEKVVLQTLGVSDNQTTVVVTGRSADELSLNVASFISACDTISGVQNIASVANSFLPTPAESAHRLERWNNIFSETKRTALIQRLDSIAQPLGFSPDAFASFNAMLSNASNCKNLTRQDITTSPLFADWLSHTDSLLMLNFTLSIDQNGRDDIIETLSAVPHVVQTDMGFFSRSMARQMVDDFNWLLWISSSIVAIALILSYGRVELFLLTFLPMTVSWVIILGLMAIFGVEFNVVNIILSTFIFGVGDDYSIFIMDGLQAQYSRGQKILASHKSAIVLSAFAAIAGLGAQVFGQHPAVHSLGLISIFGLIAVIVTSFVVQPVLFRLIISRPSEVGFTYTLRRLLRFAYVYGLFVFFCLVSQVLLLFLFIFVHPARVRRRVGRRAVCSVMRFYLFCWRGIVHVPSPVIGNAAHPTVVVANHQSFDDILSIVASSPNLVFVVKSWVTNSPIFGVVARSLGFFCVDDGGAFAMPKKLKQAVEEGCSIVVFPEGTRSPDCVIRRFHKGAFMLACELKLPITPVVIYGNGLSVSKKQPFNISHCSLRVDVLPEITTEGIDAQDTEATLDLTRKVQNIMRAHFADMKDALDVAPSNPFYPETFVLNYLYRGSAEYREAKKFARTAKSDAALLALRKSESAVVENDPLGLKSLWLAWCLDVKHVMCLCPDNESLAFCQASPLIRRIEEKGGKIEFSLAAK